MRSRTNQKVGYKTKALSLLVLVGLVSTSFANAGVGSSLDSGTTGSAASASQDGLSPYAKGRVIIELKQSTSLDSNPENGQPFTTNSASLRLSLASIRVRSVGGLYSDRQVAQIRQRSNNAVDLSNTYVIQIPANSDVLAAVEMLKDNPDVLYAEPDYLAVSLDEAVLQDTETPTPTQTPTETPTETATDGPSPTPTETATDEPSATPTETATPTPTEILSETPTETASSTPENTATPTPSDTATPSQSPTNTHTPSQTLTPSATSIVSDPLFGDQWGLQKIEIAPAWAQSHGSPNVIIAFIDSGVDLTHPDLSSQLWLNPGEIAANGIDDDNNGYIDDVRGWNFVADNNDVADDSGHGTLVTGVGVARDNAVGIAGVCSRCRFMPVKVANISGTANYSDIALGILYAAQKGAKVINISLGGYSNSTFLRDAIQTAREVYGVVVVAGAGNDDSTQLFYPAAYEGVLGAAGTDEDDLKAVFSNYGDWVAVSAPSTNIITTASGGGWVESTGTSMAAPFVSGLAGLLRSLHPDWTEAAVRLQIVHTAQNIDAANPTYAGLLGGGRLSASGSMQTPHPLLDLTTFSVNGVENGRAKKGGPSELTITLTNDWWNATGVEGRLSTTDSFVTITSSAAGFGDIPAGESATNGVTFKFSVLNSAGFNHVIPFRLRIDADDGYFRMILFNVLTESNIVNVTGTLLADATWTNNKIYHVVNDNNPNFNVPTGRTLTIEPGTVIRLDPGVNFNVRGTLIADGAEGHPIVFERYGTSNWNRIFFDDTNVDASVDGNGNYLSGSILRHVEINGANNSVISQWNIAPGLSCTNAAPYLAHIVMLESGINCTTGSGNVLWLLDSNIGRSILVTGDLNAYRNAFVGLIVTGEGRVIDNIVKNLSCSVPPCLKGVTLGSGVVEGNQIVGGVYEHQGFTLKIVGSDAEVHNNAIYQANISIGPSANFTNNVIGGNLTIGANSLIDHNIVHGGEVTVGNSSTVTWNTVEDSPGTGLTVGGNVTAQFNRIIGNAEGMIATSGLIEHNIIANNLGVGLQFGAATVQYNSLTGNQGNAMVVKGETPILIAFNNTEANTGPYNLYIDVGGADIQAQNNWWGTANDTQIQARIYDWNEEDTKALVLYSPRLVGPDQTAPPYVRSGAITPDVIGIEQGAFEVEFSKAMDFGFLPSLNFYDSRDETWTTYITKPPRDRVGDFALDPQGDIWATTLDGLYEFRNGEWEQKSTNYGEGLAVDKNGIVWFGTGSLFRRDLNGNVTSVTKPDGTILAIGVDNENGLWISLCSPGTEDCWKDYAGELYYLDSISNDWVLASVPDWLKGVHSLFFDNAGGLWVGIAGRIAYRSPGGTWSLIGELSNNTANIGGAVWAIAVDLEGNLWVGGETGVAFRNRDFGNWIKIKPPGICSTPYYHVNGITVDLEGTVWIGFGWQGESHDCNLNVWALRNSLNISVTENATWLDSNIYRATYDFNSLVPRADYTVLVEIAQDADGMVIAPFNNAEFTVDYAESITDTSPPVKPTVNSNNFSGLTAIAASWSSSDPQSGIDTYRYGIGTSPGVRDVVSWTLRSNTSVTHSGLKLTAGQTYYVTVQARNGAGIWSQVGNSIGIIAGARPAAKPVPVSPANNSLTTDYTPLLDWNNATNAARYGVMVSVNSNFSSSVVNVSNVTSSQFAPTANLAANTRYYWRVRSFNAFGQPSAWSSVLSFTTTIRPPTLVAPANNATISDRTPLFDWGNSLAASGYTIQISRYSDFHTIQKQSNTISSEYTMPTNLTLNVPYYWRVRATGTNGPSSWSQVRKFTIQ